jgi:hypothetical protein
VVVDRRWRWKGLTDLASGGGSSGGGRVRQGQRLGHPDAHHAARGALESLHGAVQRRVLQTRVVDKEEAVAGDETAVLLRHAAGHEAPDHNHRFAWIHWILQRMLNLNAFFKILILILE